MRKKIENTNRTKSKTDKVTFSKRTENSTNNKKVRYKNEINKETIDKRKTPKVVVKKELKRTIEKIQKTKSGNEKGTIRLNKYLSNAGICSRRDADVYIKSGNVTVNGKVISEMGYQVQPNDLVRFDDTAINPETKRYVLLNKPKDYITTLDDEKGRRTVMDLVASACNERIYPVGRLDRNTTGLLLFTNDGELAKKLTHPKYNVHKIYHVVLDKKVEQEHLIEILNPNFKIEDIPVLVDEISFIEGSPKNEVGIEIHSGRNRIVRKIFENFGYSVTKLDRVVFAGLTKKDLPKGKFRHLTEKEIINLKNSK
jgi:23S rRNA pseudouridine2605 synthase